MSIIKDIMEKNPLIFEEDRPIWLPLTTFEGSPQITYFDLGYYESGLSTDIEGLFEGEKKYGNVEVKRKFVPTCGNNGHPDAKMFVLHT